MKCKWPINVLLLLAKQQEVCSVVCKMKAFTADLSINVFVLVLGEDWPMQEKLAS